MPKPYNFLDGACYVSYDKETGYLSLYTSKGEIIPMQTSIKVVNSVDNLNTATVELLVNIIDKSDLPKP